MSKNSGYAYESQVGMDGNQTCLLDYLCRRYVHSTREQWKDRIEQGEVILDGKVAQAEQLLTPGKILVWNRPPWEEPGVPLGFEITYQDRQVLVVDKPNGLPTLPGGGFLENTLLHLVQRDFPHAKPMHRLGRGTSGLVLFALTDESASMLGREWPEINKQYLAIASGHAQQPGYDIRTKIGPVHHPRLGQVYAASESGKSARSVARCVKHSMGDGRKCTLFEVDLLTGRPHQIRIHLASIDHPLLGDPMYKSGGGLLPEPGLPSDLGYSLHARKLQFRHPVTRSTIEVIADLPPEFSALPCVSQ